MTLNISPYGPGHTANAEAHRGCQHGPARRDRERCRALHQASAQRGNLVEHAARMATLGLPITRPGAPR